MIRNGKTLCEYNNKYEDNNPNNLNDKTCEYNNKDEDK